MTKKAKILAPIHREEECEDDCPLRPHFQDRISVHLTCEKYVQLLIEARETDPGCWPPGLEDTARLLERARHIEEQCAEKHGEFSPELLTRKLRDEYLKIHLALDDALENLQYESEEKIRQVSAGQAGSMPDDGLSDEENFVPMKTPGGTWTEINPHPQTENFA